MSEKNGSGGREMYRPRERLIYRYNDGVKDRRADPMVIQRELAKCEALDLEIKCLGLQTPEAALRSLEAVGNVTGYVRTAFSLPLFEDGGLSEAECIELLNDFCLFVADLKKKASSSPTCSTPTEPAFSGDTDSLTRFGVASTSTSIASPIAESCPSPPA